MSMSLAVSTERIYKTEILFTHNNSGWGVDVVIACVCLTGGEVRCNQTWANNVDELLDHCIHCARDRDSI